MIRKEFSLTLDTKRGIAESPVVVVQGDTGNVFHLRIQDNGTDIDLTDAAVIVAFRGAGGGYTQDMETGNVTAGGAVVSFPLEKNAVSLGTNSCDVQIYTEEGAELITSAAFTFECRAATVGEGAIGEDPSLPIVTALMRRMQEIADTFPEITMEAIPGGHRITVTNHSGESAACDVTSGVYVGGGDMPEGYNVQIDPESAETGGVSSVNGRTGDVTGLVNTNGIGEVTARNLEITKPVYAPNLLNEAEMTNGIFVAADGSENSHPSYKATGYIPVEPGKKYVFTWDFKGIQREVTKVWFTAAYDENKTVIPSAGSNTGTSEPILIAEGVHFVRLTILNNANYSKYQFEQGETGTEYHEYGEILSAVIKKEYIPPVDISGIEAFEIVSGQNLWNRADPDVAHGKFLSLNGTLSDNAPYTTGEFIRVKEGDRIIGSYLSTATGQTYAVTNLRAVAAYGANKEAVAAKGVYSVQEYIVPAGIEYIRICLLNGNGENFQIQKAGAGESFSPYKEYETHYELKKEYMFAMPGKPVHAFLPADIYAAVGRTIELYNEQIVLDHEKYRFQWVCPEGNAYKRKFSITGATAGDKELILRLYDDNGEVCWSGRSVIHVAAASVSAKKILPIGDSLTNCKRWLSETMLLSGDNIEWVGTRYADTLYDSEGNTYASGTIHHEGRSGWSAGDYLADTEYTFDERYDGAAGVPGTANPFWDGEKFSLRHYLTTQPGVPEPDAVQIFLGTNDLAAGSAQSAAENIIALIDAIRSEYASMPIFLCHTIYRSNQNGYGSTGADAYVTSSGANAWQYDQDAKVMQLMVNLSEGLKGYANLYFVPLASCMDREYDFGQVMTKVNPRSSVEVPMPAESVHPQNEGYYQMADEMFSAFCAVWS